MSRYTVVWTATAERQLAAIWLRAHDRRAVTMAQAKVDALLSADPVTNGTDLPEGLRKLAVTPLLVFFSVDPLDWEVEVSWVTQVP